MTCCLISSGNFFHNTTQCRIILSMAMLFYKTILKLVVVMRKVLILNCLPHKHIIVIIQYNDLTRFNKISIQGTHQMAVDKEAIRLSRVYSYDSKYTCPYSMCNPP